MMVVLVVKVFSSNNFSEPKLQIAVLYILLYVPVNQSVFKSHWSEKKNVEELSVYFYWINKLPNLHLQYA